jgi:hypothetical protein
MTEPAPRCRNGHCVKMAPGICRPCADRLERWLDELPGYVHTLTTPVDMPCCHDHATPPDHPARGARDRKLGVPYEPTHPNPAPAGDIRPASTGVRVGGTRDRPLPGGADRLSWLGPAAGDDRSYLDRGDPRDGPMQVGLEPLGSILAGWARLAAEELGVHKPARTVADLVAFLVRWQPEIVKTPWSDAYAVEVHDLWATARRMTGEAERWVRIGACTARGYQDGTLINEDGSPCGESLSARPEAKVIRCPSCGADWARELWLLLGAAIEGVA